MEAERGRGELTSPPLLRTLILSEQGPTHHKVKWPPLNVITSLVAPSPNKGSLRVSASTVNFGRTQTFSLRQGPPVLAHASVFYLHAFGVKSMNPLPKLRSLRLTPVFSSNSLRVLTLTCLTLICFELLFICSKAVVVQFLPRVCSYPAAPPQFVEETVLSSSNGLSAFV